MNSPLATILYALCSLLLAAGSVALLWRDVRSPRPSPAIRWFALACACLLAWVVTLFLFGRSRDEVFLLWVGRGNFAAVTLAVYAGWRFVRALANRSARTFEPVLLWLSLAVALLAQLSPGVAAREMVGENGRHVTEYGPLFIPYVAHILALLIASVWTAFRSSGRLASDPSRRDQLLLVGWGIVGTGAVSLVSNALLPAARGNFALIDVGPLSTLLLLLAVGYAIVRHRLFDIRVFVRRALVLGVALSLVLACYSALVLLATDRFASSDSGGLTRFGVLLLAFSFDPVRRFLEKRIDGLLFSRERSRLTSSRQHARGAAKSRHT